MNHFFGILAGSPSRHDEEHRLSIRSMRSRYPSRMAASSLLQGEGLTLMATNMRHARLGHTSLYLLGEIYNQDDLSLATSNGTSLAQSVLEQYLRKGDQVFSTWNGAFAVLISDHHTGQYKLIGDQMGALQVFYHVHKDYVLFASELKFLFCHSGCPRDLDWTTSLKRPIPFLVVNAERHQGAWFKDINLLEGGCLLEWSTEGSHGIRHYWNPWLHDAGHHSEFSDQKKLARDYTAEYMDLLEDAVRLRIPAGGNAYAMFSGGMDSTVIAALAKKYTQVNTFSFATPATLRDGATEMGLRLAHDLGVSNTQVLVPFKDLAREGNVWTRHIWSMESPFAHKDAIGKVALHAAISAVQPGVHHLMSGTGSDQLNGGLVRWFVENAADGSADENWERVMREIRMEMLKPVIGHQYDTWWGSRDLLRHEYLATMSPNPLDAYPWTDFVRGCLHANQFILMWDELRSGAWLNRGVRFPFMDHRFVPFVLNVPRHLHSQLFFDKQILRHGAASILPDYLTHRPKAPVIKPGEDTRHEMYSSILLGHDEQVLQQLLETMRNTACPVDPVMFESRVRQLHDAPDLAGWTYVMHLAGLVTLSRLPDLDEQQSNMHELIMPRVDVLKSCTLQHMHQIRTTLEVPASEDILQLPLQFSPGCSLVKDVFSGDYFLVKDGEMCFQLDQDLPQWQIFLEAVDGVRSANALCADTQIEMDAIREFFQISLEEGILTTLKITADHGTN